MKNRILLVNKFYYPRGGDCVYTLNLETLLKSKGYDVAVFAMQYPENLESVWTKYFASEVSFAGGIKAKVNAAKRLLGYGDIKASFTKILKDFCPDIVHLQNIHSYLSPILAKLAKEFGCRVVWTLHDYKLLCPAYVTLLNGKPCDLCYTNKVNVVKHRCMKGSLVASVFAYVEALKWSREWIEQYVDAFVCPSPFMAQKMAQGGFDESKLNVICNFLDPLKYEALQNLNTGKKEDYYLYVGRISEEKGLRTLMPVAAELPYKLKVAGDGPLLESFKKKYGKCENIEFLGFQSSAKIVELLAKARFSVVPSECFENCTISAVESICAGTPLVGSSAGGLRHFFDGENGICFKMGDKIELKESIIKAYLYEWNNENIKANSLERFSPERYFELIQKVYH